MMRIHLKLETLTDPVAVMVPEYASFDTFRDLCMEETGVQEPFDLILDNKCHSKITAMATLRDEDILILRPGGNGKRARHATSLEEVNGDPPVGLVPVANLESMDVEEDSAPPTPAEEEDPTPPTQEEEEEDPTPPTQEEEENSVPPTQEEQEEDPTPPTQEEEENSAPPTQEEENSVRLQPVVYGGPRYKSRIPWLTVSSDDFDRSYATWKGRGLIEVAVYEDEGAFLRFPFANPWDDESFDFKCLIDHRRIVKIHGDSSNGEEDVCVNVTDASNVFQFMTDPDIVGEHSHVIRELRSGLEIPRLYKEKEITGTGTHFAVQYGGQHIIVLGAFDIPPASSGVPRRMIDQVASEGVTDPFLHVTCISLTSRTDRRDAIRRNVASHLPQLVFFDAVDPEHVPRDILQRMQVMPKAKEGSKERKSACWASHIRVLEEAVDANAFPHLVLEDDVCIPASFDVPLDTLPTDGVSFLGGKMNAPKIKDFKEFERARRTCAITAAMTRNAANPLDKTTFRISSSSAYVVPTREVAHALLGYLYTKKHITHFDIDLFKCPAVTSMWFPSPFQSDRETARVSSILTSQTQLFTTEYTRMR